MGQEDTVYAHVWSDLPSTGVIHPHLSEEKASDKQRKGGMPLSSISISSCKAEVITVVKGVTKDRQKVSKSDLPSEFHA